MWGKGKSSSGYQAINTDFSYPSTFVDGVVKLFSILQLTVFLFCLVLLGHKIVITWPDFYAHTHFSPVIVLVVYFCILLIEAWIAHGLHKNVREGRANQLGQWILVSLMMTCIELAVVYFYPLLPDYSDMEAEYNQPIFFLYNLPIFVLWFFKALTTILSYKIFRFLKNNVVDEYSGILTQKF